MALRFSAPAFPRTISSQESRTKFMYSSKPTIEPSKRTEGWSYSHTCTRVRSCKNLNMVCIGWFCSFCSLVKEGKGARGVDSVVRK